MRLATFAFCCAALVAAPQAAAQSAAWSLRDDPSTGVAMASHSEDGDLATTISCRAPDGAMVITDYTLGRRGREVEAQVQVDDFAITVPGRFDRGENGERALLISLPQAPPVLAAVREGATMTVSANGRTRTLPRGAPQKMAEVAYNCWPRAS
jgi:hypothetical protein